MPRTTRLPHQRAPRPARLAVTALVTLVAPAALAQSQEPLEPGSRVEATEVVRRINARDDGRYLSQTMEIIARDKKGNERKREARFFRRYTDNGKQSLIRYTEPSSMKGTAFLTYDYSEEGRADDQWLYIPAQRRARRISASERGSSFLGTDFTYENIKNETKVTYEDYDWTTVGWQNFEDCQCIVIEGTARTPKIAKELDHERTWRWIDSSNWLTRKIVYYDDEGEPLRTITAKDITEIDGIWTTRHLTCENHETGGSSEFRFTDHDYGTELGGDLFSQDALRRSNP